MCRDTLAAYSFSRLSPLSFLFFLFSLISPLLTSPSLSHTPLSSHSSLISQQIYYQAPLTQLSHTYEHQVPSDVVYAMQIASHNLYDYQAILCSALLHFSALLSSPLLCSAPLLCCWFCQSVSVQSLSECSICLHSLCASTN